ncbi:IS110 family transposase [Paeniglutamicibacter sp. ABSL32-1]|nr:IS110 family transposase [Paeniglutamicibacter quisquiliarum]
MSVNNKQITELVKVSEAAPFLEVKGFGAVTVPMSLTVWSHPRGVHSETVYASLTGLNPIPAASGHTVRYRLNRGADRSLNWALHMVSISRMSYDEAPNTACQT